MKNKKPPVKFNWAAQYIAYILCGEKTCFTLWQEYRLFGNHLNARSLPLYVKRRPSMGQYESVWTARFGKFTFTRTPNNMNRPYILSGGKVPVRFANLSIAEIDKRLIKYWREVKNDNA